MQTLGLVVLVVAALGCRAGDKKPSAQPDTKSDEVALAKERVATTSRADALASKVRARADELLIEWTEAQKRLDFPAYLALYDRSSFRGVKRTNEGKVRDYDFAGWQKDRKRMFENKFEIATEPLSVRSWLDDGVKLKKNMIEIRFVQRWRNPRYADHGVKVLHAWYRDAGDLKITYEDLLNSETSWDRVADDVAAADIGELEDGADALAAWQRLAPKGSDYHIKLASIPEVSTTRRAMARVLIEGGNFTCTRVVEYSECGDDRVEWDDLDPEADFDEPCLRRQLALWSLDQLEQGDLAALATQLVAIASLPEPEQELIERTAAVVAVAPEAVRMAVYRTLSEELIELDDLSEKALVELATHQGVDAAAAQLDEVRHLEQLIELLGDGEGMEVETRLDILERLRSIESPKVVAALQALTSDNNCELAMEAALALAERKDDSFLPRRKANDSGGDEQALCMLVHDPDDGRRQKRLAEWIGPGGFQVTEKSENGFEGQDDDDDDGIANFEDDDYEKTEPEAATTDSVEELQEFLERVFLRREGQGGDDRADLMLKSVEGRPGFFIDSFDFYRWTGCPC